MRFGIALKVRAQGTGIARLFFTLSVKPARHALRHSSSRGLHAAPSKKPRLIGNHERLE